ncbi:MAG: P-loop NTPase [Deltaproteobacteria bacterium]|nr:P-loop NTPase [Deltaproteobacteria bacterium]
MKLCVCGKGGSGKSTVVALLANGFSRRGKEVVVLDSDESNSSLYWMLGLERPPVPLMEMVGGKKSVQQKLMAKLASGAMDTPMSIWQMESITTGAIPQEYVSVKPGRKLVATGKILQSLEGCACPMGTVTKEFLKKFRPAADEVVLVDMEAGIEHFGRGVETGVDGVLSVVEPSLESISLAAKVKELTESAGALYQGAVLNKIASPEQGRLVTDKLGGLGVSVLGAIGQNGDIQSACLEGKPLDSGVASAEVDGIVSALLQDGTGKPHP